MSFSSFLYIHMPRTTSPAILPHSVNQISTHHKDLSSDILRAHCPRDTAPAITSTPSTTASQQTTWLPPPASSGNTPQPLFNQDFDLYPRSRTQAPQAPVAPSRRSLDSTQPLLFNTPNPGAYNGDANPNLSSVQTIHSTQRSTRPPVPLFHSNSTGSLNNYQNIQQFQQVNDQQAFTMGGGEINVAYDGTFGDLSAADGSMFDLNDNFDFTQFGDAAQGFTAINDGGMATGGTVSPNDVFNTEPPSTSFTNLTTPGSTFLETPDEDFQTSPLFTDNLNIHDANDKQWFSLFPEDSEPAALPMARTTSSSSANQVMVHPGGEAQQRKRSSTNASPMINSPAVRHSSVAGVNARKRDKPLPPIMVDESDAVALKRARNTAAARKSRAKKVEERETLEAEIADLKQQVEHWKSLALGRVKAEGGDE